MSDATLYDIESVLLATLLLGFVLGGVGRRLRRSRLDLSIGLPVVVGVATRLFVALGISISGLGQTLRGPDEITFLRGARKVGASGFDSGLWLPSEFHRLHEIVFALQIKLGEFPEGALRVTQVAIATIGILLIVAAIYDLAGPRAARLSAWAFALEPASIFFNSFLHREPLLVLASGLVVLGGTKIWTRLDLHGVLLLGMGCTIALGTRPYAAWFLVTGGLLLILHASLRQMGTRFRTVPLIYAVAIVVAAATPAVVALTSQDSLEQNLQNSQDANTDPSTRRGEANSNNLSLERVDFSTRSDLLANLPRRIRDVVLRPYPWQVQNTNQQVGAIGTLVVFSLLYLLFRYFRRNRGQTLALTAPILYPALFLLIAYALSVGNAGTGFRYRTHLVLLGIAVLIVLREHALRTTAAVSGQASQRPVEGVEATVHSGRTTTVRSARPKRSAT